MRRTEYLAAGETKVDTFTVTSLDGTTKDVAFVIHGANDAPVVTSRRADRLDHRARRCARFDQFGTRPSGTVKFTDADLSDTHTVTVTGVTASGATSGLPVNTTLASWLSLGTLTDSGNGATGFGCLVILGAGQELRLPRRRPEDDPDLHGAGRRPPWHRKPSMSTSTITGANDAPTILSETNPANAGGHCREPGNAHRAGCGRQHKLAWP